jgi:hypothetical protein
MGGDFGSVARAMAAEVKSPRMGAGWWLLAIAIASGTNLLDFLAAPRGGAAPGALFAIAAFIRVALVFWLTYALIRRMAGLAEPGRITVAFGRFVLFQIGLVVLVGAVTGLATRALGLSADGVTGGITSFVAMSLVYLVIVRLFAWQAALAIGDGTMGPGRAWRALAGHVGPLAGAYLAIAGFAAVHAALTRLALATDGGAALAGLALVDGAVSAVQLVLTCALGVVAYRLASGRAGALREANALA